MTTSASSWPPGRPPRSWPTATTSRGTSSERSNSPPRWPSGSGAVPARLAFAGTHDLPNFFRKPFGPGWALVGDAGYHKDPQTAQGITDAFLHAELLANALHETLEGSRAFDDALLDYQLRRDDAVLPMYDLTCELAALEPPPPEVLQLLMAARADERAADTFASVIAGSAPVAEFFGPENAERLLAGARP